MCGIAGWVRHTGGTSEPSVSAVAAAMRHRGPDDGGEATVGPAHLVFRRLALLDLPCGGQPASDERGRVWSVFNGEIYNYRELRDQLSARGHRLAGTGDASLIPHAYEEWGGEFVRRLRGMFALAVFDADRDELLLARDRFGIKPLFVLRDAGHVFFGSEAKAVMAAVGPLPPDPESTWHYLTFGYVPDPMTPWQGLTKLPPAHVAVVRDGRIQTRRYWEPQLVPGRPRPLARSAGAVHEAMQDSVAAHLTADVPVGCYLSSGVDSSYLAALAARRTDPHTFTVGFEDATGGADELAAARSLAAALGTQHHEEVITADEYLGELPRIVASQEGPLADPSAPALWFLARAAGRVVKAVLSGEGADELFAGYPIFRQAQVLRAFNLLPPGAKDRLRRAVSATPEGWKGRGLLVRGTTPLEERFVGNAPLFTEAEKSALLGPAFGEGQQPRPSWTLLADRYAATRHLPELLRMQDASLHTWLPSDILMKADKMSMAHSLEVRVPFLDPVVFEVASQLPVAHRVRGRNTKVALRAAAAGVLSTPAAMRPKLGFPVPFRQWLDETPGSVHDLVDAGAGDLFDRSALVEHLTDTRRPDSHRRKWALLVYLLWRQAYASGDAALPRSA